MKKYLIIILLVSIKIITTVSASNDIIPSELNSCLKIEGEFNNFSFSPDGKNIAYTIGNKLYKNGKLTSNGVQFSSTEEIQGISFLEDNDTILKFSNITFNSPVITEHGINYNNVGYINRYPLENKNDIFNGNKKYYGNIFKLETSKDGKSYAFLNSFIITNGNYVYIIKDGERIGPFDTVYDIGYDYEGGFGYHYLIDGKQCINSKGNDTCDDNKIKLIKDDKLSLYKKETEIIPIHSKNGKSYFTINNTEVGPFDFLYDSNIVTSNDKSKFAITNLKNNLFICDFKLNTPNDLEYMKNIKNIDKIESNTNKVYKEKLIHNLRGIKFSPNKKDHVFLIQADSENDYNNILIDNNKGISNEYSFIGYHHKFLFSENGKKNIFLAKKGEGSVLVYDYNEIFTFEKTKIDNININNFSGGEKLKDYALEVKIDHENSFIIKNGKKIDGYEKTWNPKFSSDGKDLAFFAMKNGKNYFLKNGVEKLLNYSIHGKTVITNNLDFYYIGIKNGKYFIVKNNEKVTDGHNSIRGLKISKEGNKFSYILKNTDGKEYIAINNNIYSKYKYLDKIYSVDWYLVDDKMENLVYYSEDNNGKKIIVKNGKILDEDKDYTITGGFNLSYNGQNLLYRIKENGKIFLVNNGVKVNELGYDEIKYSWFLDNGKIAYIVKENNNYYFINDGKIFDFDLKVEKENSLFYFYYDLENILYIQDLTDMYRNIFYKVLLDGGNYTNNNINYNEQEQKYKNILIKSDKQRIIEIIDNILPKFDTVKLKKILLKIKHKNNKNDILKYLEAKINIELKKVYYGLF